MQQQLVSSLLKSNTCNKYVYVYYKCFLSEWKTNTQKIHDHNWNPINPQSYTGAVELSLVLYCLFEAAWRLTAIIISPDEWWGENVKSTSRATARKSHKKSCLHKTHWLTKKDVASWCFLLVGSRFLCKLIFLKVVGPSSITGSWSDFRWRLSSYMGGSWRF